jgi:hypothetical protein
MRIAGGEIGKTPHFSKTIPISPDLPSLIFAESFVMKADASADRQKPQQTCTS